MFKLNSRQMAAIDKKLLGLERSTKNLTVAAKGCPNCNGQCKNGCGVTCVAILS